jgi:hypothetical protein
MVVNALVGGARRGTDSTGERPIRSGRSPVRVDHVAVREPGVAAYAITATHATGPGDDERARRLECGWQRERLPDAISELVIDGQRSRNPLCWLVFDC